MKKKVFYHYSNCVSIRRENRRIVVFPRKNKGYDIQITMPKEKGAFVHHKIVGRTIVGLMSLTEETIIDIGIAVQMIKKHNIKHKTKKPTN